MRLYGWWLQREREQKYVYLIDGLTECVFLKGCITKERREQNGV